MASDLEARKRKAAEGFCGRCGHHLHQHGTAVSLSGPGTTGGRCTGEDYSHGGLHIVRCTCPCFRLAYRNEVSDKQAETNRSRPGAYTFNAFPPGDYEGLLLVYAAVRVGDHAHVKVCSGRHVAAPHGGDGLSLGSKATLHYGYAGKLVLRWPEWVKLRDDLEPLEWVRIAEVECPTDKQAMAYLDGTVDPG